MANTKISALTSSTTPLAGTEVLPIVQSSATVKVSVANLTAGRAVSAASLALTTSPLPATSGGTGSSSAFTSNGVAYANSTTTLATGSTLVFNGTNLGIGITPSVKLHASTSGAGIQEVEWLNNSQAVGANVGSAMVFTGTSSNNGLAKISGAFTGATTADGGYMAFSTRAVTTGTLTEGMRLDATNNLTISNGNLIIGTSGKGIDFSATSGAGTSELFADYEEGTWTPNQGSGLTVVGAFSSAGYYTKIGNIATVTGYVKGATSVSCTAGGIICTNAAFPGGVSGIFWSGSSISWSADSGGSCGIAQNTASLYSAVAVVASDRISFTITYRV